MYHHKLLLILGVFLNVDKPVKGHLLKNINFVFHSFMAILMSFDFGGVPLFMLLPIVKFYKDF